jgi:hypothetical protein
MLIEARQVRDRLAGILGRPREDQSVGSVEGGRQTNLALGLVVVALERSLSGMVGLLRALGGGYIQENASAIALFRTRKVCCCQDAGRPLFLVGRSWIQIEAKVVRFAFVVLQRIVGRLINEKIIQPVPFLSLPAIVSEIVEARSVVLCYGLVATWG